MIVVGRCPTTISLFKRICDGLLHGRGAILRPERMDDCHLLFSTTPTTCNQGGSVSGFFSTRIPNFLITPIEA